MSRTGELLEVVEDTWLGEPDGRARMCELPARSAVLCVEGYTRDDEMHPRTTVITPDGSVGWLYDEELSP